MYKIAIIGDRDSVLGFMALGFSVFEAENAEDAGKLIDKLAADTLAAHIDNEDEGYAVIYITQSYAEQLEEKISSYYSKTLPAIVPVPDINGSGYGEKILKRAVERAVGADILFKN